MSVQILGVRSRWFPLVVLSTLAFSLAGSEAAASNACRKVKGRFTLEPVSGPECTSPVGICARGAYTGDFAGDAFFVATSVIQTVDSPTTGVVLVTGDDHFTTADGGLTTKDAIVLRTVGADEFSELDTVIAGTGEWAGATGVITATGTMTIASGGQGTYSGEVCRP